MKLLFMTFIASLLTFFSCGAGKPVANTTPANTVKLYRYTESGSMAQPNLYFEVERVDNNNCRVIYFNRDRTDYNDPEERDTVMAPASLLDEIGNVVAEYKMYKYKSYYNSAFEVMDGTSWGMSISFMDSSRVSSGGYMAWPKDDGIKIIEDLMRKQIKGL